MFFAAFTSAWPAYPQAVHRKRAWLSRDFGSTCPHAEHRWLVNAGLIFSTRPGALSSRRPTSSPQPDLRISLFSPALARTFRPGLRAVPLPDRVMALIWRSSTLITSNLLQVPRRALAARPPVPVLLDRQVPHVPGVRAVAPQHRFLGGRGEQPVPEGHANTLATTTDIPEEVKRRSLPDLKAGDTTPQS